MTWPIAAVTVAVALALVVAVVAVPWAPAARLDHRIADWGYRQTYGHPGRTSWWVGVALYGQPIIQRALMLVLAAVLAVRRRMALAVWLVALVIVENLVAPGAKYLLNRPRPEWDKPIAVEHSTSFPSGHATAAATFALAVLLLLGTITRSRPRRLLMGTITISVALTICADRILLGVHYLSDVVGGMLLGILITIIAWWVLGTVTRGPGHAHSARRHALPDEGSAS